MMRFLIPALIWSLAGIGVWYGCYRLSAGSRIRKARKKGTEANLSLCRITYLVTGIIAQAVFWAAIYLLYSGKLSRK